MNSTRGRPRGGSDARERLLRAATDRFLADGYDGATLRSIAAEAGVDHSLVRYHFGSKEALFAEVLALAVTPGEVLDRALDLDPRLPREQRARQLVTAFVSLWEQEIFREPVLRQLRRGVADDEVRAMLTGFLEATLFARLAEHVGGAQARRRAAGIVTVVLGFAFSRYVLELDPLRSLSRAEVVETLAPMVAQQIR